MSGNTRISRRTFTAMCPIALVPTAWLTMDCFGSIVNHSLDYLYSLVHDEDGPFDKSGDVGVTALLTTVVLRCEKSINSPTAVKGLKYLEKSVQPDGGIYTPGRRLESYETCLATRCFGEANSDRRYDRILRNAEDFVKTCQWDESKGQKQSDMAYGGAGYGKQQRPDLSNTASLLAAIRSSNAGPSEPAVKKALLFVSRCQNVEGAGESLPAAHKGGFHYSCASGGGPRSCGVMTYSGLRSLLDAGVAREDERVKAAIAWIRNHYDMKSNPGMGGAGLYHYYHICAKTLSDLGGGCDCGRRGNKAQLAKRTVYGNRSPTERRWFMDQRERMLAGKSSSHCDGPRHASAFILSVSRCKVTTSRNWR